MKNQLFCALSLSGFIALSASTVFAQEENANPIETATLEGISFTEEDGKSPSEKSVICYFIFQGKPTNYFSDKKIDPKTKAKKIIVEFNDVTLGSSPISVDLKAPFLSYKIESKKIDANATVKGLNPEWHDQTILTFDCSEFPVTLRYTNQYNIIQFAYTWTTDVSKIKEYAEQEKKNYTLPIALGGVAAVGAGVAVYAVVSKPKPTEPPGPLDTKDLPNRP